MTSLPTGPSRPGLVAPVCLAAAALSLFGALNSYQTSSAYSAQYHDAYGAARAQMRFAPVAGRVPNNSVLGYITDIDASGPAFSSSFLAAQYTLAPRQVILVNAQSRPEWAVGNFSKPLDYSAAGAVYGYEVASDEGNGVILFRRTH